MQAAYYIGNHTFELRNVPTEPPAAGQVAVEVAFAGICGTDLHAFHGKMDKRIGHNRIIGHEMSGTIVEVGQGVERLKAGTKVVVRPLEPGNACPACRAGNSHICHNLKFLGLDCNGAFQQRWNVSADLIHVLPEGVSLQDAALVEPLAVACHDIRRGRVQEGEDVLVLGGGPIGVLIALCARAKGANVVVSEPVEVRRRIVRDMGLECLDPSSCDLPSVINQRTAGKGADVVFEVAGVPATVAQATACAATRGRIVIVAIHSQELPIDLFRMFWRELEVIGARVYEPEDFDDALEHLKNGIVDTSRFITEIVPMQDITGAFTRLTGNLSSMKTVVAVA
jgi:2-desacetyl-2-hydroxyethyl bacteriochlorophyllide A dehydrogenase